MALQPREKKMLKILGIVAAIAAVSLFLVYRPKKPAAVESSTEEASTEAPAESTPAPSGSPRGGGSGSAGGGSRGGGSRGGGSASVADEESSEDAPSISREVLSRHSSLDDCWVVLDDGIYNISGFLSAYPTQQKKAAQYCGTIGFNSGFIDGDSQLISTVKSKSSKVGNL